MNKHRRSGKVSEFVAKEEARAIEAVLMVATDPVEPSLLAELVEMPVAAVEQLIDDLDTSYRTEGHGFRIAKVASGYRFQSDPQMISFVERFASTRNPPRLSAPALETLAVVAYKQPVSKAQIAAVRGVNSDGVVRALCQHGYIEPVGRARGPGQAVLYGTTKLFLEHLGINDLSDLPPLAELLPSSKDAEEIESFVKHGSTKGQPSVGRSIVDAAVDDDQ